MKKQGKLIDRLGKSRGAQCSGNINFILLSIAYRFCIIITLCRCRLHSPRGKLEKRHEIPIDWPYKRNERYVIPGYLLLIKRNSYSFAY